MLVVLDPEQAAQVVLLSADLDLTADEVVRQMLSGQLLAIAPDQEVECA